MVDKELQKEKQREYAKRYYDKNKEACKQRTKEHPSCVAAREKYRNKPEVKQRMRNRRLMQEYGITNEDYEKMLEDQDFRCAGCGIHQNETDKKLHVDHCHDTGVVRGILCGNCNRALGLVKDSQKTLLSLHAYLEKQNAA